MANKLDSKKIYAKLDQHSVGQSIELLPDQMRQVLDEARLIKVPRDYGQVTEVVVNGMGGSNLGTHIARCAFQDRLKVPVIIVPGYHVPAHVEKNTLYVISSYSGATEEPLTAYHEAKKRGAKIMAITENSPKSVLMQIMLKDDIPGYIFKPEYNPSGQPRLGLGYSIFGQTVMLAKAGLFQIKTAEMKEIIELLEIWTRELRAASPTKQNSAKKLAIKLKDKIIVFVGAEHLIGNLHVVRNQVNECAKQFGCYLEIPDLNHYTMEGLGFPAANRSVLAFLFFDSMFYHPRNQKRFILTKEVVKKNKVTVIEHELKGKTKLIQCFELLQLGAWLSYYLGVLNNVDPVRIPYVDWFKAQLK